MAVVILKGLTDLQANGIAMAFEKDILIDFINDELDEIKVDKIELNEIDFSADDNGSLNTVTFGEVSTDDDDVVDDDDDDDDDDDAFDEPALEDIEDIESSLDDDDDLY